MIHYDQWGVPHIFADTEEGACYGMGYAQAGDRPLASKTVVVTGTLPRFNRKEIQDLIKQLGGKTAGAVSKKTDYVVAGQEVGSKLTKAQALGVTVLDEAEFLELIGRE